MWRGVAATLDELDGMRVDLGGAVSELSADLQPRPFTKRVVKPLAAAVIRRCAKLLIADLTFSR